MDGLQVCRVMYKCIVCGYYNACYIIEINGVDIPNGCVVEGDDAVWEEITDTKELMDVLLDKEMG